MDQRKPSELEIVIDKMLGDLQLDLTSAKHVTATGVIYNFLWDDRPFFISFPPTMPNTYSHVFRMEIEIAELNEADAGRILYEIALYVHVHDCTLIRVVPKPSTNRTIKVLLQVVGLVDWLKPEFISDVVINMADLAIYFRDTMTERSQRKTA
ncbi:MAG: hypothetical protein AB7N80_01140 [Bdellovibrionales bacterium]